MQGGWEAAGTQLPFSLHAPPFPSLFLILTSGCSSPPTLLTGSKEVQVRLMARGEETVLGDAASDSEVFLTTKLETR